MAINLRRPHIYDAEYPTVTAGSNATREVILFNRSQSTQISYTDAAAAAINRAKGFEDTNMTEDGRVTECGIIVTHLGVSMRPGNGPDVADKYAADVAAFLERGYAELTINESQVILTARIKDLVPRSFIEASGAAGTTVAAESLSSITLANKGHLYEVGGVRIPRGVRFRLALRWDRALVLPSAVTPRIEAELWGMNLEAANPPKPPPVQRAA